MITTASPIKPSSITAKPLAAGLAYWMSKSRANGRLPSRQDLDPVDIPALLPYVELTDVIDGGADFRFRLVGTHLVDIDGINPTGKNLSSFFQVPSYKKYQLDLYHHVLNSKIPIYSSSIMPLIETNSIFKTERLYCPLSSDDENVDCILNFQICKGLEPGMVTMEMAYDPTRGEGMVAEVDLTAT